ncbi:MAG TPA: 2-dehydro-3-deoxy-6-phosphogalactonate aldolase [Thermohalobaculum sp.]|nr:2-dehydro-3-deoxy-6-phosphogalactonate aldolase [Thermohalobaculum sp.]
MTGTISWINLEPKLVAILRGITLAEVPDIVAGLLETGFRAIEIPLNSPDPFRSIEAAVRTAEAIAPGNCLIGAGTVLSVDDVLKVHSAGGNLIVSPNVNPAVIQASISAGMVSFPGVFTPTEAHLALASGATGLKFFPASHLGPEGIGAIRATLPDQTQICAVGGVDPSNFAKYRKAGVQGFGLGSKLYKPSTSVADVFAGARNAIDAYRNLLRSDL